MTPISNKAPRCKQRGINNASQSPALRTVYAASGGELNPKRLIDRLFIRPKKQSDEDDFVVPGTIAATELDVACKATQK
jgi:hypothetical protein